MAVKEKEKAKEAAPSSGTVGIPDLEKEFELPGTKIRQLIRYLGHRAPEHTPEGNGFGPRAKYSWDAKSPELKEIRTMLKKFKENPESAPKAPKREKAGKADDTEGGEEAGGEE